MNQIVTMMTMIATNCRTTRSRISFCDVLGEPPRSMLARPRPSTRATAPTARGTAYKARRLDMDILLAFGGAGRYHGGAILKGVPPCGGRYAREPFRVPATPTARRAGAGIDRSCHQGGGAAGPR